MKFFCIGDEDTVRGFRLAGIEGQMVSNAAEAAAALERALKRSDLGVLIMADTTAAEIREQVDAVRLDCERPLLVEVAGPLGPVPGRKSLRQLVQEAVGIRISQEEESE